MKKLIFLLLILSLLTRVYFLFSIPQAFTHDEGDLYATAYGLAKTGTDQYNNSLFFTSGFLTAKPNTPIYISALAFKLLPINSVVVARLPFAVLNSLIPLLLFLIVLKLTKNKLFAFFSFLTINFSPWFSYLSPTGYEGFSALLFALATLFTLLAEIDKKLKISLVIIFSFLLFNSYMGIRTIFPIILFLFFLIYSLYKENTIKVKVASLYGLITIAFTAVLFMMIYIFPNTTLLKQDAKGAVVFLNQTEIEGTVWYERLSSIAPPILVNTLTNKISVLLDKVSSNYFYSFNLTAIFKTGDSSVYSVNNIGLFYFIDFVFFVIGLSYLYKMKNKSMFLLLTIFFIGGIPLAFSAFSPTLIFRAVLLIIPYTTIIAWGMYSTVKLLKNHQIATFIILMILTLNTLYFNLLYQIKLKHKTSEFWHTNEKTLSDKLGKTNLSGKKVTVFNKEAKPTFILYSFYSDLDTDLTRKVLLSQTYRVKNIEFISGCPTRATENEEVYIFRRNECKSYDLTRDFVIADDMSKDDYQISYKDTTK